MECLRLAVIGFLVLITMSSGVSHRQRNRCKVSNLRFQRHVDLKRYVGRYIHIKWTIGVPSPVLFNIRTIAKLATPDTLTTYSISRSQDSGKCEEVLLICQQLEQSGPLFNFTFFSFDGKPTTQYYLARTNYVSYLIFYDCFEENSDGTCKTPNVVVESKWNDRLSRRDRMEVKAALRRLCVDESLFFSVQQGPRCPEPEDIKYEPLSGPRREDRHRHRY